MLRGVVNTASRSLNGAPVRVGGVEGDDGHVLNASGCVDLAPFFLGGGFIHWE